MQATTQAKTLQRAGPARTVRARRRPRGDLIPGLLFILPAAIGFLVFYLWPTLRGFYLSLTDYSLFGLPRFVGLKNFQQLIHDKVLINALGVTLEYVVINIGVQTIVALGIAVLMHRLTESTVIRGAVLLPYLVANVVVALVWLWMLDSQLGIVNVMLGWFGVSPEAWFGNSALVIPTIALVNVWKHMGYTALLIFAGLQTIPRTVYEAAAVDGSTEWRTFWRITIPLLRPVLVLVLIMTVIGSFQVFDTVAVTSKGGPGNASRVIQYYIYEQAFSRSHFGYASALSVVLFVILAVVAIVQMRVLRGGESDLD